MSDRSAIEWTDATWNPVSGCHKVSPGCEHCYAERLSHRWGRTTRPWTAPYATENVQLHPERLRLPLTWRKPRRVFVNSMSDLFHEQVPDDFIDRVFGVMALCPQHTFLVLTKRVARLLAYITGSDGLATRPEMVSVLAEHIGGIVWDGRGNRSHLYVARTPQEVANRRVWPGWPLPNVWLGVSAEDQRRADERLPLLVETPAAVRFVSAEPLLGPLNLYEWLDPRCTGCGERLLEIDAAWRWTGERWQHRCDDLPPQADPIDAQPPIDWVIGGGESAGPAVRRLVEPCPACRRYPSQQRDCLRCGFSGWAPTPAALTWARSLRDQCREAGAAFFWKQWGGPSPKAGGRLLDGREWNEMPDQRPVTPGRGLA